MIVKYDIVDKWFVENRICSYYNRTPLGKQTEVFLESNVDYKSGKLPEGYNSYWIKFDYFTKIRYSRKYLHLFCTGRTEDKDLDIGIFLAALSSGKTVSHIAYDKDVLSANSLLDNPSTVIRALAASAFMYGRRIRESYRKASDILTIGISSAINLNEVCVYARTSLESNKFMVIPVLYEEGGYVTAVHLFNRVIDMKEVIRLAALSMSRYNFNGVKFDFTPEKVERLLKRYDNKDKEMFKLAITL